MEVVRSIIYYFIDVFEFIKPTKCINRKSLMVFGFRMIELLKNSVHFMSRPFKAAI